MIQLRELCWSFRGMDPHLWLQVVLMALFMVSWDGQPNRFPKMVPQVTMGVILILYKN